jgi:hypothetical protein
LLLQAPEIAPLLQIDHFLLHQGKDKNNNIAQEVLTQEKIAHTTQRK